MAEQRSPLSSLTATGSTSNSTHENHTAGTVGDRWNRTPQLRSGSCAANNNGLCSRKHATGTGSTILLPGASLLGSRRRDLGHLDTSYKPAAFLLYQFLGGSNMGWVSRLDLETGYQHHSNGKDGQDSRFIDLLYIKPTFVWRAASSHFFFAPKAWIYLTKSSLNADISDYIGYVDLEATWRADFGLQLETHTIPAKEVVTFNAQATYPLSRLWRPLRFYALVDFWTGAGETLLRYDVEGTGFLFGVALSR